MGGGAQEMMADVMALMRTIAVHNPLLIHQHFSRRMDGAPHAPLAPQQPPPDFYDQILVRAIFWHLSRGCMVHPSVCRGAQLPFRRLTIRNHTSAQVIGKRWC